MSDRTEVDRFAGELRDVRAPSKKMLVSGYDEIAALGADAARGPMAMRTAADEVARLSRRALASSSTGHAASSLLRAIAEAAPVEPPDFGGVEGRGPDESVIAISQVRAVGSALFLRLEPRRGQKTTFVDGYFYRTEPGLLERLSRNAPRPGQPALPADGEIRRGPRSAGRTTRACPRSPTPSSPAPKRTSASAR